MRAGPTRFTTNGCGQTPDDLLAELHDRAPDLMDGSLANARRNLNRSRVSVPDFMEILGGQRLTQLMRRLKERSHDL